MKTHHGKNSFRLTLCLCRRFKAAQEKAQRMWAELKRDIADRQSVEAYCRQLKRCEKLQALLEGRVAP